MPNAPATKHRTMRLADDLWAAAAAKAEAEGTTVTEVVRDFLTRWVAGEVTAH